MKPLEKYNPAVLFIYFLLLASLVMFAANPVMTMIAFVAMNSAAVVYAGNGLGRAYIFYAVIFVLTSLANPVFSHNGVTVLLVVNDNPITLEAVLYGVMTGFTILSVLLLFRVFSTLMTSDRLLYIFGRAFPKLGLLLSMTLRFVPLFGRQRRKIENTQKTLGLYKNENAIDTIKGKLSILSAMTTWGLENGIVTADSMSARGYGIKRSRTSFSMYRFERSDAFMLCAVLLSCGFIFLGIAIDKLKTDFYPRIELSEVSAYALISYVLYALIAFFPFVAKLAEREAQKKLFKESCDNSVNRERIEKRDSV
ncbi:MAG: energy-coupling factor transporter transmembrane protein EcfT [Lachnospiraceae bacterium]|nr:energy-coupling factor transporter transmembrane protein EcfT [Lachnospiraceae bacterium]